MKTSSEMLLLSLYLTVDSKCVCRGMRKLWLFFQHWSMSLSLCGCHQFYCCIVELCLLDKQACTPLAGDGSCAPKVHFGVTGSAGEGFYILITCPNMWMGYGLGIHQDMGTREKLTFAVVYIFV